MNDDTSQRGSWSATELLDAFQQLCDRGHRPEAAEAVERVRRRIARVRTLLERPADDTTRDAAIVEAVALGSAFNEVVRYDALDQLEQDAVLALQFSRYLRAGLRSVKGGQKGGQGTRKAPADATLAEEVRTYLDDHPNVSRTEACKRIGKRHGIAGRTVARAIRRTE